MNTIFQCQKESVLNILQNVVEENEEIEDEKSTFYLLNFRK